MCNGRDLLEKWEQINSICPEFDLLNDVNIQYRPMDISDAEYRLSLLELELEAMDSSVAKISGENEL
jgi:hypothetical protein